MPIIDTLTLTADEVAAVARDIDRHERGRSVTSDEPVEDQIRDLRLTVGNLANVVADLAETVARMQR